MASLRFVTIHHSDQVPITCLFVQIDHHKRSIWAISSGRLLLTCYDHQLRIIHEESLAFLFYLLVDSWNGCLKLIDRLLEIFDCHLNRLVLQLPHECFINQCEQLLDQRAIFGLRFLSQHQLLVVIADWSHRLWIRIIHVVEIADFLHLDVIDGLLLDHESGGWLRLPHHVDASCRLSGRYLPEDTAFDFDSFAYNSTFATR